MLVSQIGSADIATAQCGHHRKHFKTIRIGRRGRSIVGNRVVFAHRLFPFFAHYDCFLPDSVHYMSAHLKTTINNHYHVKIYRELLLSVRRTMLKSHEITCFCKCVSLLWLNRMPTMCSFRSLLSSTLESIEVSFPCINFPKTYDKTYDFIKF